MTLKISQSDEWRKLHRRESYALKRRRKCELCISKVIINTDVILNHGTIMWPIATETLQLLSKFLTLNVL